MKKLFTLLLCFIGFASFSQDFEDSPPIFSDYAENHAVADFNGDGYPDIITFITDFPFVEFKIYKNTKSYPFSFEITTFYDELKMSTSSEPVDYDGDGDMDIIYAESTFSSPLFALDNDGQGNFTAKDLNIKGKIVHLVADMNGDKIPDILALNYAYEEADVLIRSASGTYTSVTIPLGGFRIEYLGVADMDGDGDMDIVMMNSGSGGDVQAIFTNNGNNTYTKNVTLLKVANRLYDDMVLGDINNDGKVDIVCPSDGTIAFLFINQGDNKFIQESTLLTGFNRIRDVKIADMNNDGMQDIIISDFETGVFMLKNLSVTDLKFEQKKISNKIGLYKFTLIDLDLDKDIDIVTNSVQLGWIRNNLIQMPSSTTDKSFSQVQIYPNPATDALNISGLIGDGYVATYYDMIGREIFRSEVIDDTSDITTLQPGLYTMVIADSSGQHVSKAIILKQ